MSAQQLRLFVAPKPLLQRFGEEFFRGVPSKPGVYIMSGDADQVLYIGQSNNLHHRLGAYKNARPDRAPRKIIRLVHLVRTIVWEECDSAEAARLRENQLLRTHRPRFNVQNTYPWAYRFIGVQADADRIDLRIDGNPNFGGEIFGAFKSGSVRAYGALLRLVWASFYQPASPYDIPAPLLNPRPPRQYSIRRNKDSSQDTFERRVEHVKKFLAGDSDELTPALRETLPCGEGISCFQRELHSNDLEMLTNFFERGPKRNRGLRKQYEISTQVIFQEELDDLLVMASERIADAQTVPGGTRLNI